MRVHPGFSGMRVTRSLVLCVMFCRWLVLLSVFIWPLFCLSLWLPHWYFQTLLRSIDLVSFFYFMIRFSNCSNSVAFCSKLFSFYYKSKVNRRQWLNHRGRNYFPFVSTWIHPRVFVRSMFLIFIDFCVRFFVFCLFSFCILCAQYCQCLWIFH